jgi:hypothetical protein
VDTSTAVPAFIQNASTFYWRVGARNSLDNPGPVPDVTTGQRYIFGTYRTLIRPGTPPGGPGAAALRKGVKGPSAGHPVITSPLKKH